MPNVGAITTITVSPNFATDSTFYVGTENAGILRTIDGGATIIEEINELTNKRITSIAISPNFAKDSMLLASSWHEAVFKSTDRGQSWSIMDNGLMTDPQADKPRHLAPHFRDVRIAKGQRESTIIYLGAYAGLFKSNDGAHTWEQLETQSAGFLKSLALSPATGLDFTVGIGTYFGGIYLAPNSTLEWRTSNKGLPIARITDLGFSPNFDTDSTLFSTVIRNFLKSTDEGHEWIMLEKHSWKRKILRFSNKIGIPQSITNSILKPPASFRGTYPTAMAISPDFASDRTVFVATRRHGVFRSVDGGLRFSLVKEGEDHEDKEDKGENNFSSIEISPNFGSDQTVFASAYGYGIYKTSDAGETWQQVNEGLQFLDEWRGDLMNGKRTAFELTHMNNYKIKLAVSPFFKDDKTVFAACGDGVFKSIDGGERWERVASSLGETRHVLAIALSPRYKDDNTVIVSIKSAGLFKSTDEGKSFFPIGRNLIQANYSVREIGFSPLYKKDNTIFAISDEELFRSQDKGETWHLITRPVRYENVEDYVKYQGEWEHKRDTLYSAQNVSYSKTATSKAEFNFFGTGITWIGKQADNLGKGKVFIDGEFVGYADQFSTTQKTSVTTYSVSNLSKGSHEVVIEVAGTKNLKSKGFGIVIDAFDVVGSHHEYANGVVY